jgi:hypothetical protein
VASPEACAKTHTKTRLARLQDVAQGGAPIKWPSCALYPPPPPPLPPSPPKVTVFTRGAFPSCCRRSLPPVGAEPPPPITAPNAPRWHRQLPGQERGSAPVQSKPISSSSATRSWLSTLDRLAILCKGGREGEEGEGVFYSGEQPWHPHASLDGYLCCLFALQCHRVRGRRLGLANPGPAWLRPAGRLALPGGGEAAGALANHTPGGAAARATAQIS